MQTFIAQVLCPFSSCVKQIIYWFNEIPLFLITSTHSHYYWSLSAIFPLSRNVSLRNILCSMNGMYVILTMVDEMSRIYYISWI